MAIELWSVYECDKIQRNQPPTNERECARGFRSARAAMRIVNARARLKPANSYTVGPAPAAQQRLVSQ